MCQNIFVGQLRWGRLGVRQKAMFECVDLTARRHTESNDTKGGAEKWQGRVLKVNLVYFKNLDSGWLPEAEILMNRT